MSRRILVSSFATALALFFIAPYVAPAPRIFIPPVLLEEAELFSPQPDYRFTSDGCSGGLSIAWRIVTGKAPPFEHCCVAHDFFYWHCGTFAQRMQADAALETCVAATGYPTWGKLMRLAVYPGGTAYAPTAWRCGYGWHFPHGYDK
jgi:hypothetical protein